MSHIIISKPLPTLGGIAMYHTIGEIRAERDKPAVKIRVDNHVSEDQARNFSGTVVWQTYIDAPLDFASGFSGTIASAAAEWLVVSDDSPLKGGTIVPEPEPAPAPQEPEETNPQPE